MTGGSPAHRALVLGAALAVALAAGGCTTNNFNCNVKDACRVPGADRP